MLTAQAIDVFTASYDLLAHAFLDGPAAVSRDSLPELDSLIEATSRVCEDRDVWISTITKLAAATATERARAAADHIACFGPPVPARHVPSYASVYLDDGLLWGRSTFDVLALLDAEELSWDRRRRGPGGSLIQAPDHVGVELAFVAVASGRPASPERARRVEAMLAHLVAWLPRLAAALEAKHAGEMPRLLVSCALSLVEADLRRRENPREVADEPTSD